MGAPACPAPASSRGSRRLTIYRSRSHGAGLEREVKCRPHPWARLDPNMTAVGFNQLLDHSKPSAPGGSGVSAGAAEELKHALPILGRDPDSVVAHEKCRDAALAEARAHLDPLVVACVVGQAVADQDREDTGHLGTVSPREGQARAHDLGPSLVDQRGKVLKDLIEQRVELHFALTEVAPGLGDLQD